jgi:antitoxin VapB
MIRDQWQVKLFRSGRNQAVRILVVFELAGTEAIIYRDADTLVIAPIRKRGLTALLDSWQPLAEDFPEIADEGVMPEEVF